MGSSFGLINMPCMLVCLANVSNGCVDQADIKKLFSVQTAGSKLLCFVCYCSYVILKAKLLYCIHSLTVLVRLSDMNVMRE